MQDCLVDLASSPDQIILALTVPCCDLCRYETIIATLCDSLDSLDEPEARAAMVWIIGEYAERIDNADELLESFLEVPTLAGLPTMRLMGTTLIIWQSSFTSPYTKRLPSTRYGEWVPAHQRVGDSAGQCQGLHVRPDV